MIVIGRGGGFEGRCCEDIEYINWLHFSRSVCGSQRDEKREREKTALFVFARPALRAEITLINSEDDVEMSSMTSILGAEVQQHHSPPGRKELIDGPRRPLCLCALLGPLTQSNLITREGGGGTLDSHYLLASTNRWVVKYDDVFVVCDIGAPPPPPTPLHHSTPPSASFFDWMVK